jgi:outer membrane protein assembly factor BamB
MNQKVSTTPVWPMARRDAANTGQADVAGPLIPRLRWMSERFSAPNASPGDYPVIARDGTIYCVRADAVYAVEPSGATRWVYHYPGRDYGGRTPPALGPDNLLLVPTMKLYSDMQGPFAGLTPNDPGLSALDTDGNLRWKDTSVIPMTSPLVDEHGVSYFVSYFTQDQFAVVALNRDDRVLHRWPVPAVEPGALALEQKQQQTWVYYLADNRLYRFRPDGHVTQGVLSKGGGKAVALVFSQRHHCLYALQSSGVLSRVDPETLAVRWRSRLSAGVAAPPVVTDSCIYVGEADTKGWIGDEIGGGVGVKEHHHTLYAISHQGAVIWKTMLDGELAMAPVADKRGDIYLTLAAEKEPASYVYCLTSKGQRRWRLSIPAALEEEVPGSSTTGLPLSSPTIDRQGTVYCFFDRLYAIDEGSPPPPGAQLAATPPGVGRRS